MKGEFTAIYEKRGRWYVAYIEELPGVNTQGRTLKEARSNLKEALQLILEVNRKLSRKSAGCKARIKEPILIETAK